MPVRTAWRCSSATSTVVRSTWLNALASAPSSSRDSTTSGVIVGGSTVSSSSASTSAGSWRFATSCALSASWRNGRRTARATR